METEQTDSCQGSKVKGLSEYISVANLGETHPLLIAMPVGAFLLKETN